MGILRFYFALWVAKGTRLFMRLLGRNATFFPGKLAVKLCPDFLSRIGKPERIVAVTGTNGKTTVCNLIEDILESCGIRVLDNRLGSNTEGGIVTSLILGSTLFGRSKYQTAVFEIDERSSRRIYPHIKPDFIVITNLFRDSIMRNAHPEYIADIISSSIPVTTKLILNGDDLLSAGVAPGNARVYFGVGPMDGDVTDCVNLICDMRICPKCHGELIFDYRRYHHIGQAHCSECGFRSPARDYTAANVDFEAMTMTVADRTGEFSYKLLSDSVFNLYNMMTAIALLREMGLSHEDIRNGFDRTKIVETRYLAEKVKSVDVVMQMAKDRNALACSRAFDYVSSREGNKEVILMMNNLSDARNWSENVCWLYDCDFEFLNRENITRIVATGPRARDYYLRLLLAGVPAEKLRCTLREIDAPRELALHADESVYVFYGTDDIDLAMKVRNKVADCVREGENDEH